MNSDPTIIDHANTANFRVAQLSTTPRITRPVVGSIVQASAQFADGRGRTADVSGVRFVFTAPNGKTSLDANAVYDLSSQLYISTLELDEQAGTWFVRVEATGPVPCAAETAFRVVASLYQTPSLQGLLTRSGNLISDRQGNVIS